MLETSNQEAEVILLSHSLGSVLATHTAATAERDCFRRPVVLVTLGSPLRTLSAIFPRIVRTPEQLLLDVGFSRNIRKWWNAWRYQDYIGQALHPSEAQAYFELSLGSGSHPDYWSDRRLWSNLKAVLRSSPSELAPAPLSTDERKEVRSGWMLACAAPVIALLSLGCGCTLWYYYLLNASLWRAAGYPAVVLYAFGIIQLAGTLVLCLSTAGVWKRRSLNGRQRLDHFRSWSLPLVVSGWAVAIFNLFLWATLRLVIHFI